MEPARTIVYSLGGVVLVAKALHLTPSGVCHWYTPIPKGCGGLVPSRHIPKLCALAEKMNLFLEPNMFFEGHMLKSRKKK
jgi:hypothetical protein